MHSIRFTGVEEDEEEGDEVDEEEEEEKRSLAGILMARIEFY